MLHHVGRLYQPHIILQCNIHGQSLCNSSENAKYFIGYKISDHVVIIKKMCYVQLVQRV